MELQCDASQRGLGACLLQDGQPVAYASRAMTETESRYCWKLTENLWKHGSMTGSGAASGQPMGRVYLHVFVLGFFVCDFETSE